jgi:ubiquitin-like-conjugating enzyme ATG3
LQDVSAEHAFKTVTIEPFPHSASLQAASVHPCKHANVMKKVIERMNSSVVAQQLAQQAAAGNSKSSGGPAAGSSKKGGKWLFRRGSGKDVSAASEAPQGEEEAEGMRVDFYLVVFLKFIASIVPTIEVDSTTAF